MVRFSILDMSIVILLLVLVIYVMGFNAGHDVAVAQQSYIEFMDKCHAIADTLDSLGR